MRYRPDGNLEFLGRIDHQVKLRGFRIELGEIEAVLSRHPAVRENVVMVREDTPGDSRLVAYVVPTTGPGAGGDPSLPAPGPTANLPARLRGFLAETLPEYMVPSAFVMLDRLPLTTNGKVDRQSLPAPDGARPDLEGTYAAPRTPIEETLAVIWAGVLGVDRIGVYDNFFHLGGHSLLATQVISRMRATFRVELPLRAIFETPTVAGLATQISAMRPETATTSEPAIQPIPRDGNPPLSFAQQRLWFLDQLEPGSPVYNLPTAVRLRGSLDVVALERSLHEIVCRHEVLRTSFTAVNGQPLQVITPVEAARATFQPLPLIDLRTLPAGQREAEAERLLAEEARRPFDLARGPLLRATLLRLDDDEYIALLVMHHIVSDGWSSGVLVQELATLYAAFAGGQPSSLPDLCIQYADFAAWQRQWLQGAMLETQLAYWSERLRDLPALLDLPTDRPRPVVQTARGAHRTFALPAELTAALKDLGRQTGVTLFMTLLAAFQVLLARYSGQDDICVGTPIANRTHRELEDLIGFFVNVLVMRSDLSGTPAFRDLLAQVRETTLTAYAHQDVPFEMLVEALQPQRDMSHAPLFQVMFVLQNAPLQPLELPNLTFSLVEVHSGTTRFDLTLAMAETGDHLSGLLEYNTDLFDATTIERMIGHFQTLLQGIVADPDQSIATLPLLTPAEHQQLLVEWNATAADFPDDCCVQHLFEAQVARTPDAVAVVFEETSLTYRELNRRANQLAHYLQKQGVQPDTLVGISVERSLDLVVAVLGVLKAGGAYVPLDPTYPPERLAFMLEDAQVAVLLTQRSIDPRPWTTDHRPPTTEADPRGRADGHAPIANRQSPIANIVALDAAWPTIAREPDTNPASAVMPAHLAYVIYTSGSTGRPKGAMLAHRGVCNLAMFQQRAFDMRPGKRVLQFAPFSFDASVWEMVMALCNGATLCLARQETLMPGPQLLRLMRERAITTVTLPPSVLAVLPADDLPDLETVLAAGEACTTELVRRWAPGRRFFNAYGPTETTVCAAMALCDPGDPRDPPIGRPIANFQLYILDRHQQPVPIGVPGEIYIGGVGLARGYLHRPDLTAEKFVPNPFGSLERGSGEHGRAAAPHATPPQLPSSTPPHPHTPTRLYRTGDLARYRPDGSIEFLGRIDHQVKLRGFRIELGEIEATLRRHPDVQDTVVLAREDTPGDKRLVAYVVPPEPAAAPPPAQLRAFLKARLPEYMLPAAFVVLEAWPLTPSGKVDRQALPAPDAARAEAAESYVAPRTWEEAILAGIWARMLGLTQVGIHSNFFDLGGHSLLATQLISRVRDEFQVELPLRTLFEAPTVAELAMHVTHARRAAVDGQMPPIQPVPRDGGLPLSFAQQRLWFIDQLEPGSPLYNIPAVIRLSGRLDVAALEHSFAAIVRRHEALRTTFTTVNGQPVQTIAPELSVSLPVDDLQHLPAHEREAAARQLATAEARTPFELAHGPLLRARLVRLAPQEHELLLTLHHIIADGWSMGVLVDELAQLYTAAVTGQPAALPALPIQYADFAVWQRHWLQGAVLESQLAYWKQQLADCPPLLELPTDRPRPAVQTFHGAQQLFTFPDHLLTGLKALCQEEGATLFGVLLAAFNVLLARYSGQEDLCIGTPIANRTRTEVEGVIGFFANTLVLRTDLSGGPGFRELLRRVRAVTLAAYAHQDLPFEMLVDALQPARDLSHTPLFQVMLAMQDTPVRPHCLPDLTLAPIAAHSGTSKFDITLFISTEGDQPGGAFEYNTDLFDATTIERMIGHFQTLLAGIVADPDQPITALPLLTEAERRQLLVAWNATAAPYPHDRCFHHLFEEQVARTPDAPAVVYEDQQLTYRELNQRANQLAHYLQTLGVGPEVPVGLCIERSVEMLVGLLGILKAGGAYVPLDPTYPPDRLAFMLADTQAPVLLTHATLDAGSPPARGWTTDDARPGSAQRPIVVQIDADWPTIACQPTTNPASPVTADHLAYVIYTSGSTGQPKGVMISHRNVLNLATGLQRAIYAHHPAPRPLRATLNAPIAFDASVQQLTLLLHGHTLYILPEQVRRDAPALRDYLHRHAIDVLDCVPTHLKLLLAAGLRAGAGRVPPLILPGGEALDPATWHTLAQTSAATVYNLYGPTECTVDATTIAVSAAPAHPTIGRPLANVHLYVLDPHQQPVPIGVPGELYIGGAGVARGYWNRPDLTTQKFVPNPFAGEAMGRWGDAEMERWGDTPIPPISAPPPHRPTSTAPHRHSPTPPHRPTPPRLYRTGDRVRYRPDGTLEFLGRLDHQVKLRGFRIELGEIEALLQHHPAVQEAVAVVREDRPGDPRLVAYVVVTSADGSPDPAGDSDLHAQLQAFLKQKLPDYMVPAVFVAMDTLPLTPSGKVDRRALPQPDSTQLDPAATYVAPRTPTEETLAALCAEVLGLERVGIHANFFKIGGHSLLATQFVSRVRDVLHVELPLRTLFEHPTIAALAEQVEGTQRASQVEADRIAQLLEQIDQLAEEEVQALIEQKLTARVVGHE